MSLMSVLLGKERFLWKSRGERTANRNWKKICGGGLKDGALNDW